MKYAYTASALITTLLLALSGCGDTQGESEQELREEVIRLEAKVEVLQEQLDAAGNPKASDSDLAMHRELAVELKRVRKKLLTSTPQELVAAEHAPVHRRITSLFADMSDEHDPGMYKQARAIVGIQEKLNGYIRARYEGTQNEQYDQVKQRVRYRLSLPLEDRPPRDSSDWTQPRSSDPIMYELERLIGLARDQLLDEIDQYLPVAEE